MDVIRPLYDAASILVASFFVLAPVFSTLQVLTLPNMRWTVTFCPFSNWDWVYCKCNSIATKLTFICPPWYSYGYLQSMMWYSPTSSENSELIRRHTVSGLRLFKLRCLPWQRGRQYGWKGKTWNNQHDSDDKKFWKGLEKLLISLQYKSTSFCKEIFSELPTLFFGLLETDDKNSPGIG